MGKLRNAAETLFGLNLPTEGTVLAKRVDPPREQDYSAATRGVVGKVKINDKPIYWLAIKPKKGRIRDVPVSAKAWKAHDVNDHWTASESDD